TACEADRQVFGRNAHPTVRTTVCHSKGVRRSAEEDAVMLATNLCEMADRRSRIGHELETISRRNRRTGARRNRRRGRRHLDRRAVLEKLTAEAVGTVRLRAHHGRAA